jgi:osmotically-inducible protein OsmY
MSTSETKNDEILQGDVVAALRKVPTIPAAHIGVSATGGAITLTGDVETVNQRFDAVEAAQNVAGVLAVADEIHVREFGNRDRTDTDIAVDVARAFSNVAPGLDLVEVIEVDVVDHVVLLRGQVPLVRDRVAAEQAALSIVGVRNVVNNVSVGPPASHDEVEQQIFEVFVNQAGDYARAIAVEIDDGHVLLKGNVPTLAHKTLAERAAYAVPGVRKVTNHLHMHT